MDHTLVLDVLELAVNEVAASAQTDPLADCLGFTSHAHRRKDDSKNGSCSAYPSGDSRIRESQNFPLVVAADQGSAPTLVRLAAPHTTLPLELSEI
ncbi:hypothetical protein [Streptomyces sp. 2131.1]|uniref:hypothetical protein n=1 Tax=Streptomyces sp. 2131.1 TaxID=1855346 RepID=UPI00115FE186|nr:hypothetical protein [Streptomyces sp. 2131.1]